MSRNLGSTFFGLLAIFLATFWHSSEQLSSIFRAQSVQAEHAWVFILWPSDGVLGLLGTSRKRALSKP